MMKKVTLLALIGVLFLLPLNAQKNHPNSKERIAYEQVKYLFGERNVDTLVVKILTENMPQHFNDPNLPQFTLIGKDRKFYMSVGGYAKLTVGYDWGNPIKSPYSFTISNIPTYTKPGDRGLLQYGVGTSNISFNFVAFPEAKYPLGAFVDIIFSESNYIAKLHYGYVKWAGFTVGYTTSLFTNTAAGPPTIDFEGPNSMSFVRNCVVDYEYKWGKNWGLGVGLEMPITNYNAGLFTRVINQKIPDIPLYFQFSWDERSSWVRLSGLLRNMTYQDEVKNKTRDNFGWGVQLSGSIVFIPQLTAYYQGIYGQGISNYVNDLEGLGMDMLPMSKHNGQMDNLRVGGGYLGLQYNFIPSAFVSATYSIVRTSTHNGVYKSDQYKNGQYVAANVFWNVNANIQLGLEYLWGQLQTANGDRAVDNRLHCMLQFNF